MSTSPGETREWADLSLLVYPSRQPAGIRQSLACNRDLVEFRFQHVQCIVCMSKNVLGHVRLSRMAGRDESPARCPAAGRR
jgi:hypothetical protein